MKAFFAMAFALILTACASQVARPVEVKIPVAVSCRVDVPTKPVSAVDALPIGSNIWQQMAALRADRISRLAYEKELEVVIAACQ